MCGLFCMPLSFFSEDQFDGDFVETEFLADGIHQVALIRKMDAFGLGDKEDKGGRFNAGLRRIRDAHGPVLKARHRVSPDGSFHQVVEGRSSHPLGVLAVTLPESLPSREGPDSGAVTRNPADK